MACYEGIIFNQQVRDAVQNDEPHDLTDDWADNHYVETMASSSEHAKQRLEQKYPASQGYVIVEVKLADGF